MESIAYPHIRELDARSGDGIEVRLLWLPAADRVFVHLIDHRAADVFLVLVEPEVALDAFRHPFAYVGPSASDRVQLRVGLTRGEKVTS